MAMKTITILCTILAIWVVRNVDSAHHAPAPSVDCSSLILNMADCLTYVTNGSTVKKPEGTCCSGLKTVLKANAECLCEAFKNSAQLGVTLNVTKAMGLPTACRISAPSVSNCGMNLATGIAPGISPSGALSPSAVAAVPTTIAGANEVAPAPAPGSSGVSALAVSFGSSVFSLVIASFSFI